MRFYVIAGCGASYDCGGGCEMYGQRMVILQGELRRQRAMIQRLYQQITIMGSTGSSCNQGNI